MRKQILLVGTLLAIATLIVACSSDDSSTPFGPDGLPQVTYQSPPASGSSAGATAENPSPPSPPATPTAEGTLTATRPVASGDRASSTFTNNKGHKERVALCSYDSDEPVQHNKVQKLIDAKYAEVMPGKKVTLDVAIGCNWQVDAAEGSGNCPQTTRYSEPWNEDLSLLEAANGTRPCENKCPDGRFSLEFLRPLVDETAGIPVDTCPDYRYATLVLTSDYPINEVDKPKECKPTGDPKRWDCKWDTPREGFYAKAAGRGIHKFPDGRRTQCATDTASFYVNPCTPCTACTEEYSAPYKNKNGDVELPQPPKGYYWMVDGSSKKYYNASTIAKLEPECDQVDEMKVRLFDEHCSRVIECGKWTFTWKGEPCCSDPTWQRAYRGCVEKHFNYDCKRVGLCGHNGQYCNLVNYRCVGKYTGKDYGPANKKLSHLSFDITNEVGGLGVFNGILHVQKPAGQFEDLVLGDAMMCHTHDYKDKADLDCWEEGLIRFRKDKLNKGYERYLFWAELLLDGNHVITHQKIPFCQQP